MSDYKTIALRLIGQLWPDTEDPGKRFEHEVTVAMLTELVDKEAKSRLRAEFTKAYADRSQ